MGEDIMLFAGAGIAVSDTAPAGDAGLAGSLSRQGVKPAAGLAFGAADRTALRRELALRFVEPAAELGIAAVRRAVAAVPGADRTIATAPHRAGILAATIRGATDTRARLVQSLLDRGGSMSGTLFSNAGYNIAGSMMARGLGLRGPVLMSAAGDHAGRDLLHLAGLFFKAGRADLLLVAYADDTAALALVLMPVGAAAPKGAVPLPALGSDDDGIALLCRLAAARLPATP